MRYGSGTFRKSWHHLAVQFIDEGRRRATFPLLKSASTLLFQCVSDRLSVRNILVDDRNRVPVFRERQTNLIDDLALSMIGLLDGGSVDLLERHGGLAGIAATGYSLPSKFAS